MKHEQVATAHVGAYRSNLDAGVFACRLMVDGIDHRDGSCGLPDF